MNSQHPLRSQWSFDPVVLSTATSKTKRSIQSARLPFPSGGFAARHGKMCGNLFRNCGFHKAFVTPLSLHTHCFTLRVVFLCQVLSPNSTGFDQSGVHHPHVSITFEKDKHGRQTCVMSRACVLVSTCALWIRVHFKHLVLTGSAAESENTARRRVCVCACVYWCVFPCALTAFEPVLAFTKNA